MTCVICQTKFSEWSWSSPPEPCDCGACVTKLESWEMAPEALEALREAWRKAQEEAA